MKVGQVYKIISLQGNGNYWIDDMVGSTFKVLDWRENNTVKIQWLTCPRRVSYHTEYHNMDWILPTIQLLESHNVIEILNKYGE